MHVANKLSCSKHVLSSPSSWQCNAPRVLLSWRSGSVDNGSCFALRLFVSPGGLGRVFALLFNVRVQARAHSSLYHQLCVSFRLRVWKKDRCRESRRCWISLSALRLGDGVRFVFAEVLFFHAHMVRMIALLFTSFHYIHLLWCQQVMHCAFADAP